MSTDNDSKNCQVCGTSPDEHHFKPCDIGRALAEPEECAYNGGECSLDRLSNSFFCLDHQKTNRAKEDIENGICPICKVSVDDHPSGLCKSGKRITICPIAGCNHKKAKRSLFCEYHMRDGFSRQAVIATNQCCH